MVGIKVAIYWHLIKEKELRIDIGTICFIMIRAEKKSADPIYFSIN